MNDNENLNLLRKIYFKPNMSQRGLAKSLGFSLGKLNYCIKSLQKKGLLKIRNLKKQENQISYIRYVLTSKGISLRYKLTLDFMKRKMKEYDELKKEIEKE
jgi:Predicted transcriptional regulator